MGTIVDTSKFLQLLTVPEKKSKENEAINVTRA